LAPPCSLGAPCPRHPTSAFFQCLRSRSPDRPILLHLGALRGLPGQSSCPELAPCERATVSGLGGGAADLGRAGRELLASIRVVAVPRPLRGAVLDWRTVTRILGWADQAPSVVPRNRSALLGNRDRPCVKRFAPVR